MVEALEDFVVKEVGSFDEHTSPEEIIALAELVNATTGVVRPLQFIGEVTTTIK